MRRIVIRWVCRRAALCDRLLQSGPAARGRCEGPNLNQIDQRLRPAGDVVSLEQRLFFDWLQIEILRQRVDEIFIAHTGWYHARTNESFESTG